MRNRSKVIVVIAAFVMVMMLGATPAFAKAKDRNHNGIPDTWEIKYHISVKKNLAKFDPDKDGLKNIAEYRSGTSPRKKDTNRNGVWDGKEDPDRDKLVNLGEVAAKTMPRVADTNHNGVLDGAEDPDRDRLTNSQEWRCHTDPLTPDTNKDGVTDGDEDADSDGLDNWDEFAEGCNPTDGDSDNDGTVDGQEIAGLVTGYDPETHTLSISALSDEGHDYEVVLNESTVLEWADVITNPTAPTLDDLKPGAIVNEVDGEVQADGSVVVTLIKIMPAPQTDGIIAKVVWFGEGVLKLRTAVDEECSYEVRIDSSTQFAWAAGVFAEHEPSKADLKPGVGVTALDVTYNAEGHLLAKRIVLIPSYVAPGSTD